MKKKFVIYLPLFLLCSFQNGYHSTNLQEKFTNIYQNNIWHSEESKSGDGSTLKSTKSIQENLPKIIKAYDIKTILDAPCGDFNWMRKVSLKVQQYIGIDIVPELIQLNTKKYGNKKIKFYHRNLVTDKLPKVDLILCRDCLMVLNKDDIYHVINNFKASGSKYLLTTIYLNTTENKSFKINDGNAFGYYINLQIAPFNFPPPLLLLQDWTSSRHTDKYLALYKLEDINFYESDLTIVKETGIGNTKL